MAGSIVLVHRLAPSELEHWIAPLENQQEMEALEAPSEVQKLVDWQVEPVEPKEGQEVEVEGHYAGGAVQSE